MEEMRKKTERVWLKLRYKFLLQQHCVEPLQPHVSPAPKSTKGSCAAPTIPGGISLTR